MPARKENNTRPRRVRVSGRRDIITVSGKNPDYFYRWVHDRNTAIQRHKEAGYEFVTRESEPNITVGEAKVGKYADVGTCFTMPFGRSDPDQYLFLMRQPMEFHEEDEAEAEQERRDHEDMKFNRELDPDEQGNDGQYGKIEYSQRGSK